MTARTSMRPPRWTGRCRTARCEYRGFLFDAEQPGAPPTLSRAACPACRKRLHVTAPSAVAVPTYAPVAALTVPRLEGPDHSGRDRYGRRRTP